MAKDYAVPFELATFDGINLTAGWKVINADGFPYPCVRLKIVNNSVYQILISFDGYYPHLFLDSSGPIPAEPVEFNFQTNNSPNNCKSMFKTGTKVYVKIVAGIPKGGTILLISQGII